MMDIFGHVQSLISDKRCPIGVEVFMKSHFMIKPCRLIEIDKINNIARCSLIDTKYCQMAFRSARWHFSRALFGNLWSIKSEWWTSEGDNLWNLLFSSRIILWSSMDKWELWLSFIYLSAPGGQCLAGLIIWVHSKEGARLVLEAEFVLLPTIVGVSWLSKPLIGSGPNSNKLRQISSNMFGATNISSAKL